MKRAGLLALFFVQTASAAIPSAADIQTPSAGDHVLRILSPTILELSLVNAKQPDPATVDSWNWVNGEQDFVRPNLASLRVRVNGQLVTFNKVGFKRRPVYAPFLLRDLRIGNALYLQLTNPVPAGESVQITNDGTLWPAQISFAAVADPLRYNPALHVNQEGYLPGYPKRAEVGYYLGDMGEMAIPTNNFFLVSTTTGATVYNGTLKPRQDVGYRYSPSPYQNVYEADFSDWNTPGEYYVMVPTLGRSLPFRIDEGIAMAYARTYALGMFHQRSGFNVAMPFTRFTHAPDHLAPAMVPTNDSAPFAFTWQTVAKYSSELNPDNPPQTAPGLTNYSAQLYPFVNQRDVSVSGGHFEAGDYNRVAYNGAQVAHILMFAADSLPGVGALDNLGIPESGDGISDVLQEAKWEADFLLRMQDADGGFYYSVYPQTREYEYDVLPENGDPQVVWPKNTATTAAVVAVLAQCSSSPRFKEAFPQTARLYLTKALRGWQFLTNAITRFGMEGSYQEIQHFDDDFTHHDELAWAACELFLATGDPQYQAKLFEWFPNPTDVATFRWGWQRMGVCYGNTIREYAFALGNGRLSAGQVQQDYLAKCIDVITNCGNDMLTWSQENAYGTSFPDLAKAYRSGGWYFSSEQAFDLAVAYQFNPDPLYLDAILRNINFEGGCNPVNVSYVTGLGWKRPRNIVDNYSLNDRRILPKDGVPIGNIIDGFVPIWTYPNWELSGLVYPSDYIDTAPYPYYDRWCDDWNLETEGSTTDMSRGFAATVWLAARTSLATQPWRSTTATITSAITPPGKSVRVSLSAPNIDLSGTRILWEAKGQEPAFATQTYNFDPWSEVGAYWVEAEVQWPDGRRAFATNTITISPTAAPELSSPELLSGGGVSFVLTGVPQNVYVIEASADLSAWRPIATNTLPDAGAMTVTDSQAISFAQRYYRAYQRP
ncbi:MAG TPA: glycoside hydrolase family 9 protein [Candidatus Limnocylindrales bacterium]|nr:glycoside hydrolase family 9 protein [Candidatus Limnocylindrales bacterium]